MAATAGTISELMREDGHHGAPVHQDLTPLVIQVSAPVSSANAVSHVQHVHPSEHIPVVVEVAPFVATPSASVVETVTMPEVSTPAPVLEVVEQVVQARIEPAVVEPAPAVDLNAILSQAGLELVHTDASMVTPVIPVAPIRQHPPRERKPRSQVADEPLQLVETQH